MEPVKPLYMDIFFKWTEMCYNINVRKGERKHNFTNVHLDGSPSTALHNHVDS